MPGCDRCREFEVLPFDLIFLSAHTGTHCMYNLFNEELVVMMQCYEFKKRIETKNNGNGKPILVDQQTTTTFVPFELVVIITRYSLHEGG